jgi:hypothetical protein
MPELMPAPFASSAPYAGSYSSEDAWNGDTDAFDVRKIKVQCPYCQRNNAPLCSSRTALLSSGWNWVGCDHKEPRTNFEARCPGCRQTYSFTLYTPQ